MMRTALSFPARLLSSTGLTAAARTSMSALRAPTEGSGASSKDATSFAPNLWIRELSWIDPADRTPGRKLRGYDYQGSEYNPHQAASDMRSIHPTTWSRHQALRDKHTPGRESRSRPVAFSRGSRHCRVTITTYPAGLGSRLTCYALALRTTQGQSPIRRRALRQRRGLRSREHGCLLE
jgi:hypothetical protein